MSLKHYMNRLAYRIAPIACSKLPDDMMVALTGDQRWKHHGRSSGTASLNVPHGDPAILATLYAFQKVGLNVFRQEAFDPKDIWSLGGGLSGRLFLSPNAQVEEQIRVCAWLVPLRQRQGIPTEMLGDLNQHPRYDTQEVRVIMDDMIFMRNNAEAFQRYYRDAINNGPDFNAENPILSPQQHHQMRLV